MIRPLIVGFATTFKHIFKKKITVNYPGERLNHIDGTPPASVSR